MNPSITTPLSLAYQRMLNLLFRPFRPSVWFSLGFSAWLMTLLEGGANIGSNAGELGSDESVIDFFRGNIALSTSILGVGFLFCLAIGIFIIWLSTKGRFVFLYQLVHSTTDIKTPWVKTRDIANSLFLWNLLVLVASLVLVLTPIIAGSVLIVSAQGWDLSNSYFIFGILLFVLGVFICIPTGYIWGYLNEFVAPIMLRYNCRGLDAWRFFGGALRRHPASLLIYPLFRGAMSLVIGFIVLIIGLLTCCIGIILLVIPYIGAVILLPVTVFLTGYSLEYLRQIGPEYDVFLTPPEGIPPPSTDSELANHG